MSQSTEFQLITMAEMELRGKGSYFIPDKVLVSMDRKKLLSVEAAIHDLMEENQDLIMWSSYDDIRHGTVLTWGPSSQFN